MKHQFEAGVIRALKSGVLSRLGWITAAVLISSAGAQTTGQLAMQRWTGLPASPSILTLQQQGIVKRASNASGVVTAAGSFAALGDNYGVRLRGTVTPPVTGSYTFYVAGDDNTALWISPDSSRFHKERIAWNYSFTAREQWIKYATQRSQPVNLVGGQVYYLEAQMQESGGSDSLAIG